MLRDNSIGRKKKGKGKKITEIDSKNGSWKMRKEKP